MSECERADWVRSSVRFSGWATASESMAMREHAAACGRADWYHALPTDLWRLTETERERRVAARRREAANV